MNVYQLHVITPALTLLVVLIALVTVVIYWLVMEDHVMVSLFCSVFG